MKIIGIDPGLSGAIAVLENNKVLNMFDMPVMSEGKKNKRQLNSALLVNLIKRNIDNRFSDVLIFSHNNSCSFLTAELGDQYKQVPTCGIIIFDFDVSLWSQVSNGKFNHYFPKSYK